MIDEGVLLKTPDDVAGKILQPDISVPLFHGRNVHAMYGYGSTRHHDPLKLLD
jgi:hypothetical protein